MGMVHAAKKGELKNPSAEVKKAAKSISGSDAKKYAKTKHKGLPSKKKKACSEKTAGYRPDWDAIDADPDAHAEAINTYSKHVQAALGNLRQGEQADKLRAVIEYSAGQEMLRKHPNTPMKSTHSALPVALQRFTDPEGHQHGQDAYATYEHLLSRGTPERKARTQAMGYGYKEAAYFKGYLTKVAKKDDLPNKKEAARVIPRSEVPPPAPDPVPSSGGSTLRDSGGAFEVTPGLTLTLDDMVDFSAIQKDIDAFNKERSKDRMKIHAGALAGLGLGGGGSVLYDKLKGQKVNPRRAMIAALVGGALGSVAGGAAVAHGHLKNASYIEGYMTKSAERKKKKKKDDPMGVVDELAGLGGGIGGLVGGASIGSQAGGRVGAFLGGFAGTALGSAAAIAIARAAQRKQGIIQPPNLFGFAI
jgi:hypothetical protein